MYVYNHVILNIQEEKPYFLCMSSFTKMISIKNHVILSKIEWEQKSAQIIPGPLKNGIQ